MRFSFNKVFFFGVLCLSAINLVIAPARAERQAVKVDEAKPYVKANHQNFSRLYWALGKFEIQDDQAIDEFIKINDCGFFEQYYFDDFEWDRVREATRNYIKTNLAEFPTRFEIIRPIELGTYDVEGQYFDILPDFKADEVKQISFYTYQDRLAPCVDYELYKRYPFELILSLTRPFTFTEVPVETELAKLYLEDLERQFENLNFKTKEQRYKRVVYMNIKAQMVRYKTTKYASAADGGAKAVVFGRIDAIEIYSDPALTRPLYFEEMSKKRRRRIVRKETPEEDESEADKFKKAANKFNMSTKK